MQTGRADAAKPLRLFIALWPDEILRETMASWQRAWVWPPHAAPVPRERLHLTLHFLGDVPAGRMAGLVAALRLPFEPFTMTLSACEVWPNGVAVLRPEAPPPALSRLHGALRRQLVALDLHVDTRPYRAHITLARRAQGATPPARAPALRWSIDSGYVLVRSLPGGAGFEVLERFS